MKIWNMRSSRSGREVANQFIITDEGRGALGNFTTREVFQSYTTTIVSITRWGDGTVKTLLDAKNWNCSRTTGKYRSQFLGEKTAETRRKIASGEYELADLN